MRDIVLLGCGGHAKSVVDTIESKNQYNIKGFIAPMRIGEVIYKNYKIIGTDDDLAEIFYEGIKYAFVCVGFIGNSNLRQVLYKTLKKIGYSIPNIIDKSAVIASDVVIEEGVFIGKNAVVNSNTFIKKMSIINTGAIIEHDNFVNEFSHISVGSILCGNVKIGENTFVGAGATVIQEIEIGDNCIIGAGSVICNSVPSNNLVVGVPGKIANKDKENASSGRKCNLR